MPVATNGQDTHQSVKRGRFWRPSDINGLVLVVVTLAGTILATSASEIRFQVSEAAAKSSQSVGMTVASCPRLQRLFSSSQQIQ